MRLMITWWMLAGWLMGSTLAAVADDGLQGPAQEATAADRQVVMQFDQMLEPHPARGAARVPLEVTGSWIGGGGNWFVTKATARGQADCVSIHARLPDDTWRLRWRLRAPSWLDKDQEHVTGRLTDPVFFGAVVKAADGRVVGERRFLHVAREHQGTGGFREDFIFLLTDKAAAEPIGMEPAAVGYQRLAEVGAAGARLDAGESINKPGAVDFGVSPPTFGFCIWKAGDANCCPTGGQVTGTFAVRMDIVGSMGVVIDTWQRGPIQKQ